MKSLLASVSRAALRNEFNITFGFLIAATQAIFVANWGSQLGPVERVTAEAIIGFLFLGLKWRLGLGLEPGRLFLFSVAFSIFPFSLFHTTVASDMLQATQRSWVTFLVIVALYKAVLTVLNMRPRGRYSWQLVPFRWDLATFILITVTAYFGLITLEGNVIGYFGSFVDSADLTGPVLSLVMQVLVLFPIVVAFSAVCLLVSLFERVTQLIRNRPLAT